MFCPKCGKQVPDNIRFCPDCGAPLGLPREVPASPSPAAPADQASPTPEPRIQPPPPPKAAPQASFGSAPASPVTPPVPPMAPPAPPKKKKSKLPLILGLAGGGVLLLILLVVGAVLLLPKLLFRDVEVDFTKYATVSFEGYDSIGTAKPGYDRDAFLEEYGEKIKFDRKYKPANYDGTAAEYLLDNYFITWYLDYEDSYELTNGDQVDYHLDVSPGLSEVFNVKEESAVSRELPFTVTGLDPGDPFDPFEGLQVSFEGMSSDGDLIIDKSGCIDFIRDGYFLEADKTYDLSNGDVVTVSISSWYDNKYFLSEYGKLPTRTSAEYTVEGLWMPLRSLDEITSDEDTLIKEATGATARKWLNDGLKKTQSISDFTYFGRVFVTEDEISAYGTNNILYDIYRYTLTAKSSNSNPDGVFTLYIAVRVDNLNRHGEELEVDLSDPTVVRHSYKFEQGDWTVSGNYGYHTVDEIRGHLLPEAGSGRTGNATF